MLEKLLSLRMSKAVRDTFKAICKGEGRTVSGTIIRYMTACNKAGTTQVNMKQK